MLNRVIVFFLLFQVTTLVMLGIEQTSASGSEKTLLSNVRQVTFEGRRAGEGYFGSQGSKLVFQSERNPENPFFQIFLLDLETGDTQQISPGQGKTTCSWIHPHGQRVLFASTHADPDAEKKQREELDLRASGQERRYSWDYDEYYDLWEKELSNNRFKQLTTEKGYDAEGSWSPDGRYIAFSSNRHAYMHPLTDREKEIFKEDKAYFLDIYIMEADGSNVKRLTEVPGYDGGPFFSADGETICWRRFSEDGATAEIYTMKPDGSNQKRLTGLGAMSWAPYFHPSGDYLVFGTNLQGFSNFELYVVDSEGKSEPVRVTYAEGFDGLASFSPDGSTLTWTANRTSDGKSQIFFADWDDASARRMLGLGQALKTTTVITSDDLKYHVSKLASEKFEGRMTGTRGEELASDYLASTLRALGLEPAGDDGDYFQHFEFTSGVSLGTKNSFRLVRESGEEEDFKVNKDWRPVAFSKTGSRETAKIIFVGYGIVSPAEGDFEEYDSYVHLDVTDKWVLSFRYLPEDINSELRQHLSRYSSIRYKAMAARDRGAEGIIFVSGPKSQVKEELIELSFDASSGTTSIGVLTISDRVAEMLLQEAEKNLNEIQKELDSGEMVMGFEIPGLALENEVDIRHEKSYGRNVLGRLSSEVRDELPAVIIGAHFDHLGTGAGMSTLARDGEKGEFHYGADDNASGVASVLEIAEYLKGQKSDGKLTANRDIVFAFWSGEELGLLGSGHFAKNIAKQTGEAANISSVLAAYLNLDMVGRLREKLILQGVGSSSIWPSEIEKRNVPVGLPIATQNDSYLPTDATSFYLKHVPVLSAFTGTHSEYHSPRDQIETLNFEGMEKVARLMGSIARSLAVSDEDPDYKEMKRPTESAGRVRLRAYLGTIPDYAQGDTVGLKLSGVIGGGPAEKAGLRAGDTIVELAGRKIENIYDYTYAIEALKIGESVKVVVERDGKELTLDVTPGSRE